MPGAALVLGQGAGAGAPLFVTALTLIAAAYMFWMCSDSIFAVQYDHATIGNDDEASRLAKLGYHFSWGTLLYGIGSLGCTIAGFAAVHSKLRLPISIEAGFVIAIGVLAVVAIHCLRAVAVRNAVQ